MKKELKLFAILLTMTFSTFTLADKTLFPIVKATYVEGSITQDTVWTLVDSPFVVSKNVTVHPNVTLTIEPEVEVRFGGKFSMIIEGRLVAKGTEDRVITFTSNSYEPEAGDWGTINFTGGFQQSSLLTYCVIEYGTNGVMIEDGTLNIQESLVKLNSENGIMVTNGDVEVKTNQIAENTMSGIYIAGGNRVNVQNNRIMLNGDGVTVTGNSTKEIAINQNEILFNGHSGILLLEADANTVILNNALSGNAYGFFVSTNTSTYITRNYISNNTVGIFYEKGDGHVAYFNDICDNGLGMDVSPEASVDAEYNYWGDKSGPYHELLNPRGRGNPVGGNGVDLDFIFFLTAFIDYNNIAPTAILWTDKILVAPNQNVTFIGTDSYDDGRVDQYFFDFGDGMDSGWTTLSLFNHSYSLTGTYNLKLTVIDDFGVNSASAEATINVQDLAPLYASVTLSNHTVSCDEQVLITVFVSDGINAAENATVTLFSVRGGTFAPLSGLTNSTGHFTATFTPPSVPELTNVRIIARASKTGYADGSDHKYLKVLPPLRVQVTAEPATIRSEETTAVNIHVTTDFEQAVADALLIVSSDYGSLSATTGLTDANGSATFFLTAPQTLSPINVTIMATAIKMGHAEGLGHGTIIVEPKILSVEVEPSSPVINSTQSTVVSVLVTYDTTPIANASVTMFSSDGTFSVTNGITDSAGHCAFVFNAPKTFEQMLITITANATKTGYISGENQATITVIPETPETGGGWPITTILLIVIPIAVLVIVLVLIKLKIIVVSVEEE